MDDLDRSIAKRTAANPHYPEMLAAELRRQEPDRSDASARRVRVFSDWNRLDGEGRIRLGLMGHVSTDFTALVGVPVLFVDGDEVVEGTVATGENGEWLGVADWTTHRDAVGDEDDATRPRGVWIW